MPGWKTLKTLIVSREEMKGLVAMREVIELVEQAFRAHGEGKYVMEPKVHIIIPKYKGEWEAMPSYLEEPEAAASKWVAIRENNREKFGLPTIMSTIVYTHPETGFPLMICDGTYHTNMRTGAAAAVSAKWLARKNPQTIGLVGAGAVAVGVVRAMDTLGKYEEARVWSRKKKNADTFIRKLQGQVGFKLKAVSTVKDAVEEADVVVTATLAISPVVRDEWIKEGTHIAALGADMEGKQELEGQLLKRSRVFADDLAQCIKDGEINVPIKKGEFSVEDVAGTIGEVIAGKKKGRLAERDITIFDSTGIALQDAALVTLEYKRALQRGVGVEKRMVGFGYADL